MELEGDTWTKGLTMAPSEYFKRQCIVSVEPDEHIARFVIDHMGCDHIVFSTDYPHGDSVFPHSMQVLSEILSDCTPEERYQMTVKNVVELYKLPFQLEGPDQATINSIATPEVKTWRNAMPSRAMMAGAASGD